MEMSSEAESRLKRKKSLAAVQKEIAGNLTLTQEITESLYQPIPRFRAMKQKEEPLQSGIAVTAEGTFERVHFIDPNLQGDQLSADTLRKSQPLNKFLESTVTHLTTVFSLWFH